VGERQMGIDKEKQIGEQDWERGCCGIRHGMCLEDH
jgi:hypothetical protein